jgi:hypothetical protein
MRKQKEMVESFQMAHHSFSQNKENLNELHMSELRRGRR